MSSFSVAQQKSLAKAEALAKDALAQGDVSVESVERVLCSITSWPTQQRPNVSPDEKAVTGMCLGAVNVLGGVGMAVSAATQACPSVSRLVARFCVESVPRRADQPFPFSSLQINYNYAARRHVDGNNIGPSYIISVGAHAGGELWTADTFVESEDGVMRGGGGEALIDPKRAWKLFNGNAEHETRPFRNLDTADSAQKCTRVSIIAFTHASYCKLPETVAARLLELEFTAGSSDGVELPFFASFRMDKSELSGDALEAYLRLRDSRRADRPPPSRPGAVGVECNGYTAGKGAGWVSFVRGDPGRAKKRRIDSFFKPKAAAASSSVLAYDLPSKQRNTVSTRETVASVDDATGLVTIELPKNRTGLWLTELEASQCEGSDAPALRVVALERFDIYKDTVQQTEQLVRHVRELKTGTIVCVSITDTAMAKTRPLGAAVYEALRLLGAPEQLEPIGYRQPFAMIGVKGLQRGLAMVALDKTKVILRLEAIVSFAHDGSVSLLDKHVERFDITTSILEETQRAAARAEQPAT